MTDRINNHEFSWEKDFKDLHPSPFGQQIYLNSIKTLFEMAWANDLVTESSKHPQTIPKNKLNDASFDNGKFLSISHSEIINRFELIKNWNPTDNAGTRKGFVNVPALVAEKPGAELKLNFVGTAIGIFVAAGPDAGIIEYKINNEPFIQMDLFTKWSEQLHLPWLYLLATDLANKEHRLALRLKAEKNTDSSGYACRIIHFVVNRE